MNHGQAAERRRHRHTKPREVVRPEVGLPTFDAREAEPVPGIVAVADVEPARRVAHRPAHAAIGVDERREWCRGA